MKKHERIAGLVLIALGIVTGLNSWLSLKLGSPQHPDAGFMPFLASLAIVVFSAVWVIGNLRPDENPQAFWEPRAWFKPLIAVGMMVLYAVTMESAGYILSTLLFMLLWQFGVEKEKWLRSILVSVISTAAMWFVFAKLLTVPLPQGFLGL